MNLREWKLEEATMARQIRKNLSQHSLTYEVNDWITIFNQAICIWSFVHSHPLDLVIHLCGSRERNANYKYWTDRGFRFDGCYRTMNELSMANEKCKWHNYRRSTATTSFAFCSSYSQWVHLFFNAKQNNEFRVMQIVSMTPRHVLKENIYFFSPCITF